MNIAVLMIKPSIYVIGVHHLLKDWTYSGFIGKKGLFLLKAPQSPNQFSTCRRFGPPVGQNVKGRHNDASRFVTTEKFPSQWRSLCPLLTCLRDNNPSICLRGCFKEVTVIEGGVGERGERWMMWEVFFTSGAVKCGVHSALTYSLIGHCLHLKKKKKVYWPLVIRLVMNRSRMSFSSTALLLLVQYDCYKWTLFIYCPTPKSAVMAGTSSCMALHIGILVILLSLAIFQKVQM